MAKLRALAIGIACTWLVTACGGNNNGPTGGNGNNPRLRVTYAGFVGQSFAASPPTLCPTSNCALASEQQTVTTEGVNTYVVADGSTYVVQGTLVGRPAPLGPPATNVSSALSFSLGWEAAAASRLLGIRRSSVRLFVNGVEIPSQNIFNGPSCGRYFETLVTPSVTTEWSFVFSVISYTTSAPPDLCA